MATRFFFAPVFDEIDADLEYASLTEMLKTHHHAAKDKQRSSLECEGTSEFRSMSFDGRLSEAEHTGFDFRGL